ncbi:transketolase [Pullulanibacillus camelliae]|uniref:Transketolase n=1 Tax=Pullulanibacillus camelliae TaxID=1707096 RepID=A0A8J2YL56_9BACL|nr:transketolase [Pullulanibacillus camelliae]GGE52547.1 transketolase [Pullulanibacillus camelliae]
MGQSIDQLSINTIRTLSIDAIEKANSGHPGMPMGAAPMAYALWKDFMNHNPHHPKWFNRDRFVLSAGHGSMLLYSLLHLFNYDVSIEDLKSFRQWGSKTPGHPEFGHTPGVDATTGPLGQGVAMAVGMAMAERHLAATYNRDDYNVVDHFTYSICGDGDMMEGVASEAASLAGRLKLGKLVVLYDSNDISLDGDLNISFNENVQKRFEAYGWDVLRVEDGNDLDALNKALAQATQNIDKPTLIEVKTTIGYGSPTHGGTNKVHGNPLGAEEASAAKKFYEWTEEPFTVPSAVRDHFAKLTEKGEAIETDWNRLVSEYEKAYPELAKQFKQVINNELPEGYDANLPQYKIGDNEATRATSYEVINALADTVPALFGGAADLVSSTKTVIKNSEDFLPEHYQGRNVWFGVREFAMAAAVNGMALHGGVKPYGSTFFVFSDYLRPAMRLSAIMSVPSIYVFTHDSIAVGEDGPTHEPIEQLASMRAIPNLSVIRPADGNETREAWRLAVESVNKPTALVLTRQGLPTLEGTIAHAAEGVKRGAYVVAEADGQPDGIILATGSEVHLAVEAQKVLKADGINVRVVSMPSWDLFEAQSEDYKNSILPSEVKNRLAVEVGSSLGWARYVGDKGRTITIDRFGASANGNKVLEEYGFTVDNVVKEMKAVIGK